VALPILSAKIESVDMVNEALRKEAVHRYVAYSALKRLMASSGLVQEVDLDRTKQDLDTIRQGLDDIAAELNDLQTLFEFLEEAGTGRMRDIPGFGCPAYWACQIRED